jgi:hypothetical protein
MQVPVANKSLFATKISGMLWLDKNRTKSIVCRKNGRNPSIRNDEQEGSVPP